MIKTRHSKLGRAIARCKVPPRSVALAWLGQAGFVMKSPHGVTLALDPYLSNSCEALGKEAGFDMSRSFPAPLSPHELKAFDAIIFTHSHQDHIDPETVQPFLKSGGKSVLVAPHEASDRLLSLGASKEQILLTWPNKTHEIGDLRLKATFAIPFAGDDLTHVGYLVEVIDGPRIYFTGDTDYNEILAISVSPYQPDIMVTVVNSAFRNLSPIDAARLAKLVNPRWVIPCHHDLFPDNSLPDNLLKTNLRLQGMQDAFCPLQHGELRTFAAKRNARRQKL